ncbi:MAG: hypothetical protein FD189_543 [Elusimicrobia bacterium]|nr:MAG: hypothetical protein FD154_1196 [Elusimicrobiota bacterium]KAF0157529.1 MAG: hypothetical protein FD189_543 [Elusimicrobiota bacterium]
MKKVLFPLLLALLPLSLYSQQKPPAAARTDAAAQPAKTEDEDGAVMIDGSESSAPAHQASTEEAAEAAQSRDPNALPASLGDVKGVFSDAGRNILVLQADDGSVNFVQVVFSRTGVSWKPAGFLYRSRE